MQEPKNKIFRFQYKHSFWGPLSSNKVVHKNVRVCMSVYEYMEQQRLKYSIHFHLTRKKHTTSTSRPLLQMHSHSGIYVTVVKETAGRTWKKGNQAVGRAESRPLITLTNIFLDNYYYHSVIKKWARKFEPVYSQKIDKKTVMGFSNGAFAWDFQTNKTIKQIPHCYVSKTT